MKNAARAKAAVLILILILFACCPAAAYASTTQEQLNRAKQEKANSEAQVNEAKGHVDAMEEQKEGLEGELGRLSGNLNEISQKLQKLENDIEDKEEEIETTGKELEEAQKVEEKQYADMKKRLQFIYERGDNVYLEMFFSAKSFGDFLNKTEYIKKISEYDHRMLEEYKQTKEEIAAAKEQMEKDREELEGLKADAEAEKKKVSSLVAATSNNIAGYADKISSVELAIQQKEAEIKLQEQNIDYLQKKLAEERAMSNLAANSSWRDISEVTFDEGDRYLLANLIYCEAGGEPYDGQVAVGSVVINRVLSSVYPGTVVGVVYQNKQFSPVASGRLALALAENRATASCYKAADEAMSGMTNVGNCVYFRTPIPGLTGIQIGGHIFY